MQTRGRYKMHTVCERTGFNQSLLRAWERRYGLLEPERTVGGHRMYTEADLAVLGSIRSLLADGRTIGEIASLGRQSLLADAPIELRFDGRPSSTDALATDPTVDLRIQGLVRAATQIDAIQVEAELDGSLARFDVTLAIELVLRPALDQVQQFDELTSTPGAASAAERLLSLAIRSRLQALLRVANPTGPTHRLALCACPRGERRDLESHAAALSLARAGVRTTFLGADLPFEALRAASEQLEPDWVCLSFTDPDRLDRAKPNLLELAERLGPRTRLLVGGPGVRRDDPELARGSVHLAPDGALELTRLVG